MLPDRISEFLSHNHLSAVTSFRQNGAAQISIVTSGLFRDGVAFTTTEDRAKYKNLVRDPRRTIMVSKPDWWGYVVLEGEAQIMDRANTDSEELRDALRDVYRAASGSEHPNWDEYDQAMIDELRAVVLVKPDHIYGTAA